MLKKIVKILFNIIFAFIIVCCGLWFLMGQQVREEFAAYKKSSVPILLYHGVGAPVEIDWPPGMIISSSLFEAHLKYLSQEGYRMVSVDQLTKLLVNNNSLDKIVAISFDDGYKNNYNDALPLLQKYNATASFYVIDREIDKGIYMNRKMLLEMIDGGMEVGSHTINHAPLALIDPKYLPWELGSAKKFLEEKLNGNTVKGIAYPNGGYNKTVLEAVKNYNFSYGLTGKVGANTYETFKKSPYEMYRISIYDDGNGLDGFKWRLERAYIWGYLQTKGIDLNLLRELLMK